MTNVNLPDAMKIIKEIFKLQKNKEFNFVPILQGNPGIGKTSYIKELAKKMDYDLYSISGAKSMEYFSGIPLTDKIIVTNDEVGEAIWSKPEMIAKANRLAEKKNVILFIDDIHLIGDGSSYLFELLLEKSLNNHKLKNNVFLIGASNLSSLSGFNGFPAAIINRMMLLPVELQFKDWYKNVGINLNDYITTFLKTNPEFINEEEDSEKPFGTYRSWTEFSILFNVLIQNKNEEEIQKIVYEVGQGFVSEIALLSLKSSIKTQQKYNLKTIVSKKVFPLPKIDFVEQLIYVNIVKYCTTENHFNKLKDLLIKTSKNEKYTTFNLNVIMEILAIKDYLKENQIENEKLKKIDDFLNNLTLIDNLNDIILKYL